MFSDEELLKCYSILAIDGKERKELSKLKFTMLPVYVKITKILMSQKELGKNS